jgi:hypothetical protein
MTRPGRDLERLVERLERALAGTTVTVTSPDHLVGRRSGTSREVDVSLRGQVGSVALLVIVECRDRNEPQDVSWIDELVGKRDDVAADKAIAVSGAGFSRAAEEAARQHGIALRTLEDVTDRDVLDWVRMSELHIVQHGFTPRRLQIDVAPDGPQPTFGAADNHRTRCLGRKSDGEMLCVEEVWNLARDQFRPIYEEMLVVGTDARDVSVRIELPPGGFEIDTPSGPTDVVAIGVEGTMTLKPTATPLSRRQYVAESGVLMQAAEAPFTLEGRSFVLSIQEKPDADGSSERVVKLYMLPDP